MSDTGGRSQLRLVGIIARRDYVRTVRRRGYLVGTVLLPLMLTGLFLLGGLVGANQPGAIGDPGPVALVVVPETAVDLSPGQAVVPRLALLTRAEAEAAGAAGTIPAWYVVPAGWPADPRVLRYSVPALDVGFASAQRELAEVRSLEAVLRYALIAEAGLGRDAQARIVAPALVEARTADGGAVSEIGTAATFLVPFAFALLFVVAIFVTSGYLLQSVTEEKENRVVEIVLSSVPSLPLMAGKLLGLGAAGLTQVCVWAGFALLAVPFAADRLGGIPDLAPDPVTLTLALLYFVLGYLAFGAVFAAIGALAPGSREAQQYSGFLGFFAVVPLVLSGVLLGATSSPLAWALALFPLTAPATMLQVLALAPEVPWGMVGASALALLAWILVATLASARVFRATLLLYGVRPSVGRIVAAVLARDG